MLPVCDWCGEFIVGSWANPLVMLASVDAIDEPDLPMHRDCADLFIGRLGAENFAVWLCNDPRCVNRQHDHSPLRLGGQ
jgi:hypothetical protein